MDSLEHIQNSPFLFALDAKNPCFICGGPQMILVEILQEKKRDKIIGIPTCLQCSSISPYKKEGKNFLLFTPLKKEESELIILFKKKQAKKEELPQLLQSQLEDLFSALREDIQVKFNKLQNETIQKLVQDHCDDQCFFCSSHLLNKGYHNKFSWMCNACGASITRNPQEIIDLFLEMSQNPSPTQELLQKEKDFTEGEYKKMNKKILETYKNEMKKIKFRLGFLHQDFKKFIHVV
ncbi:MAG: hypothetical protein N3A54_03040 [Patescibacteria group bacterium]|nr:hypothetical protein [Patescibacteria group bacterium]